VKTRRRHNKKRNKWALIEVQDQHFTISKTNLEGSQHVHGTERNSRCRSEKLRKEIHNQTHRIDTQGREYCMGRVNQNKGIATAGRYTTHSRTQLREGTPTHSRKRMSATCIPNREEFHINTDGIKSAEQTHSKNTYIRQ